MTPRRPNPQFANLKTRLEAVLLSAKLETVLSKRTNQSLLLYSVNGFFVFYADGSHFPGSKLYPTFVGFSIFVEIYAFNS